MKRRLLNALAGLSLILALATGGLWGRSYWHFDRVSYYRAADSEGAQTYFSIFSRWGQTAFYRTRSKPVENANLRGFHSSSVAAETILKSPNAVRALSDRNLGFGFSHIPETQLEARSAARTWKYRSTWTVLLVPYWAIALATALPPLVWCFMYIRQRRRVRVGHCTKCGYDLRATPQRCPECGRTAMMNDE